MCGDIMSIWNVRSVVNGLIHLTGIVSAVLMSAVAKLGNRLYSSISRPINTNLLYSDGTSHQRGWSLRGDIEVSQKLRHLQFSVLKGTKTVTPINARRGIENMGIDAETITLATLTETLSSRSLIYSVTNAFSVAVHQLRLTTSYLYQRAVQTISITYSHYANLVTLGRATDESYL